MPENENTCSDAIIQLLNKMVKRFENTSLLREVVSKGSFSQLFKVLSSSERFHQDRKSYLEKTDCHGTTLLMSACRSGQVEVVEFLLANGARVQEKDDKQRTALHFAALNNSVDVVKLLLRADGRMNDEDCNGLTPLHCASQNGRTETVVFLIENGSDVNRPTRARYGITQNEHFANEFERATALHLAAQNGQYDTVKSLMQKGAKINALTSKGQTSLMLAAEGGHVTTAELLFSNGVNINVTDQSGKTALEYAAIKDQLTVAELLIEAGICVKTFVGSVFCEGLLKSAVKRGKRSLLESLIDKDDKTQNIFQEIQISPWNKTLLHVAAETKGNAVVVDLLVMLFDDVNVSTSRGQSPLHFAADVSIARSLVEAGANVNIT